MVKSMLFSLVTLYLLVMWERPEFGSKAASMTQEQLAGILFHSLRDKIMTLPDDVIVIPLTVPVVHVVKT
jgi:hypothetical protein